MSLRVDEDEHSLEMHLPYIREVFAARPVTLVPILVGSLNAVREREYVRVCLCLFVCVSLCVCVCV